MKIRARILLVVALAGLLNLVVGAAPANACSEELGGTACARMFVCDVTRKVCL